MTKSFPGTKLCASYFGFQSNVKKDILKRFHKQVLGNLPFLHGCKLLRITFLILILSGTFNFTYSQTCPSITIVRQPTSFDAWTGYSGTANNFSIYATSSGGTLTYQWERSTDNGVNWTPITANIDAGTTYSSFNAATLYYTNTSGSITALDGYKYRVKVSNSTCFTYSNVVTLRVFGPSFFPGLVLPTTTNYCSSSPSLAVELNASNSSSMSTFTWERRVGPSGTWVAISVSNANTLDAGIVYSNYNTSNLQLSGVNSASEVLQFRCKVTISVVSTNVIQTSSGSTTNSNTNTISNVYSSVTSLAPGSSLNITQMPATLASFCAAGTSQTLTTSAICSKWKPHLPMAKKYKQWYFMDKYFKRSRFFGIAIRFAHHQKSKQ